jgi:hypothetical protein
MATKPGLQITPAPTWHGRLMQPARRLLLRLLAPMMSRFLTAHDELWAAHLETTRRLEETQRRLDLLTEEIAAANALVWDQVALARRLADLEDRLVVDQPIGVDADTDRAPTG